MLAHLVKGASARFVHSSYCLSIVINKYLEAKYNVSIIFLNCIASYIMLIF